MLQSYILIDPKTELSAKMAANRLVVAVPEDKKEIPIAQVRQLIAWAGQRGFEAGEKVGVILSAQHLSLVAQHALLKLLEEPVVDTTLVLTVDSVSTILPTIRSRCAIIQLHSLESDRLEEWGLQQTEKAAAKAELPLAELLELTPWQRLSQVAPLWQAKDSTKIAAQVEAWRTEVGQLLSTQPNRADLWVRLGAELEQATAALGRYTSAKLVLTNLLSQLDAAIN